MATLKLSAAMPDNSILGSQYGELSIDDTKPRLVRISDEGTGEIVLKGKGFVGNGNTVAGGEINSVTFTVNGKLHGEITGLTIGASDITQPFRATSMLFELLAGNDKVIGSNQAEIVLSYGGRDRIDAKGGRDSLSGGTGNDVLIGGTGSDTFVFDTHSEADVIRDFDAVGGGKKQDHLRFDAGTGEIGIQKQGHDVVLTFAGGQVTLLDVRLKDVDASDWGM